MDFILGTLVIAGALLAIAVWVNLSDFISGLLGYAFGWDEDSAFGIIFYAPIWAPLTYALMMFLGKLAREWPL